MGLSNKTARTKWGLIGLIVAISSAAAAEANRIARDPATGPAAHAASFAAVVTLWSNWLVAVLAAPLAIACLLYYAAVLYESKLAKDIIAWWRAKWHRPG